MSRKIRVSFELTIPVDATDKQIQEWLDFELFAKPTMFVSNPLADYRLEADADSVGFDEHNY